MHARRLILALALAGASTLAQASPDCAIRLKAGDDMRFDQKSVTVSASCQTITIELEHTGRLPAAAMGHNVVLTASTDADAVAGAGLKAGAAAGYVPADDRRILAATPLIGSGQKATASLPGNRLRAGGAYTFFCSFPGHSALMRGTVVVAP